MGDDYWDESYVANKAKKQNFFDRDDNDINDGVLNADRATAPNTVLGGSSARQYTPNKPTIISSAPPAPSAATKQLTASAIQRSFVPSAESTRAHRIQTASTSNNNETGWLPSADEFSSSNSTKNRDGSSLFEKDMEARCRDLIEDKNARLDDIRDFDKKSALLRAALKMDVPHVVVPVMMFLENSLSRSLFYELLKKHPLAMKKYIAIAKLRLENDYYIAMLKQFGRNEDVAMIRIRNASQTNDVVTKITILDQTAIDLSSHPWWQMQIAEQRQLLIKQREFQTTMSNVRLENRTALETYKLIYENEFRRQKQLKSADRSINDRSSQLENLLHMSPELIMCGKLSSIMHCGIQNHYDDFVHQAIHHGLFGRKYIIAPEYLADMVYNWVQFSGENDDKANERTAKLLNMITDPERRYFYAEKFQNFDVAIDTIVNVLRDRTTLETLRRRMPHSHPSYLRATSLLETSKWRN